MQTTIGALSIVTREHASLFRTSNVGTTPIVSVEPVALTIYASYPNIQRAAATMPIASLIQPAPGINVSVPLDSNCAMDLVWNHLVRKRLLESMTEQP